MIVEVEPSVGCLDAVKRMSSCPACKGLPEVNNNIIFNFFCFFAHFVWLVCLIALVLGVKFGAL